jgi:hypothetical protein
MPDSSEPTQNPKRSAGVGRIYLFIAIILGALFVLACAGVFIVSVIYGPYTGG